MLAQDDAVIDITWTLKRENVAIEHMRPGNVIEVSAHMVGCDILPIELLPD